jgi:D-sedoheptulose 7-phosphate isomerase
MEVKMSRNDICAVRAGDAIIHDYLAGLRACIDEIERQDIAAVVEVIYRTYLTSRQLFIFGNGGSAATASHMVCDLRKGAAVPGRRRIKAFSLTDNVSLLTAVGNDIDYESIFVEQLIDNIEQGDAAIGISASGNSPNVLAAIAYAREYGATTVGFTGFGGGKLKGMADVSINLSSRDYGQVEDMHLALEHIITCMVRERVRGGAINQYIGIV